VASLFLLGTGIAGAVAPFLAGWIAAYDPRIMFAASSVSVVAVTFSIVYGPALVTVPLLVGGGADAPGSRATADAASSDARLLIEASGVPHPRPRHFGHGQR
jgi:hypothetical protein